MDTRAYYQSISGELHSLKNRVRHLIDAAHWPTDGEWKESVLRSILRRTTPENITVGRGFVVDRDRCSRQIDVLVYDNAMPVLYRDGDLAFIPPAACRGIVEVKSSLGSAALGAAATKLANTIEWVRRATGNAFLSAGLFAFDFNGAVDRGVLEHLRVASQGDEAKVINHVALGPNTFVRFWEESPSAADLAQYRSWHLYDIPGLAAGYFIHNLLVDVSRNPYSGDAEIFFPREGKEARRVSITSLMGGPPPGRRIGKAGRRMAHRVRPQRFPGRRKSV